MLNATQTLRSLPASQLSINAEKAHALIGSLTRTIMAILILFGLSEADHCWWCDSSTISYLRSKVVAAFDGQGRKIRSDSLDFFTGWTTTVLHYDSAGRETAETSFVNCRVTNTKKFTYDAAGNIIRLEEPFVYDPGYHVYSYDARNLLTEDCKFSLDDFKEYCYTYEYNAGGKRIKYTGSDNWYYIFTYENHDSMASSTYFVNGTQVWQETYDYQFDSAGRMLQKSINGAVAVRRQYDQTGRMIKQLFPYTYDTYEYDPITSKTSVIKTNLTNNTPFNQTMFGYDPAGRIVSIVCYVRETPEIQSHACLPGETCDTLGLPGINFIACGAINIPKGTRLWLKTEASMFSTISLSFRPGNGYAPPYSQPNHACSTDFYRTVSVVSKEKLDVTIGSYTYKLLTFDTVGTWTILHDRHCDWVSCLPEVFRVTVYEPSRIQVFLQNAVNHNAISLRRVSNGTTVVSVPREDCEPFASIEAFDIKGRIVAKAVSRRQGASLTVKRPQGVLLMRIRLNFTTRTVRILSVP